MFSSERTGAATTLGRETLANLPTISGRLNDVTRLTPQSGGTLSFAGQDSRLNNITVDGSYVNNSFGLRNSPGDTSGVAPISLAAIEPVLATNGNVCAPLRLTVPLKASVTWVGVGAVGNRVEDYVAAVKEYVDALALYKINVLHLHLADDQGWRIEIKRHPRLTGIGSWPNG